MLWGPPLLPTATDPTLKWGWAVSSTASTISFANGGEVYPQPKTVTYGSPTPLSWAVGSNVWAAF